MVSRKTRKGKARPMRVARPRKLSKSRREKTPTERVPGAKPRPPKAASRVEPSRPASRRVNPSPLLATHTPEYQAYADMARRLVTLLGHPLDEVFRRLDADGGRTCEYHKLVRWIAHDYGVPEAYASLVARVYRAAEGDDQALGLARFLRSRAR